MIPTFEQNIRMEVIGLYAPDRLGWAEIGEVLGLWNAVVEPRG